MNSEVTDFDEQMMRRCLELAKQAAAKGNTAVGAVITLEQAIIAEAEEQPSSGATRFQHAEILAVTQAADQLSREQLPMATLYTTAEPCFLCGYAVRAANIGRVVIGSLTPHIGAVTSKYPILTARDVPPWGPPPEILRDVMREECDSLRR